MFVLLLSVGRFFRRLSQLTHATFDWQHGKLDAAASGLKRISDAQFQGLVDFQNSVGEVLPPTADSFCYKCADESVQGHGAQERQVRGVQKAQKALDQGPTKDRPQTNFWISKAWVKQWKAETAATAKQAASPAGPAAAASGGPAAAVVVEMTADLFCEHGNLRPAIGGAQGRTLINQTAWRLLCDHEKSKRPDGIKAKSLKEGTALCPECQQTAKSARSSKKEETKDLKNEREEMIKAYNQMPSDRKELVDLRQTERRQAVASSWMQKWRESVRPKKPGPTPGPVRLPTQFCSQPIRHC